MAWWHSLELVLLLKGQSCLPLPLFLFWLSESNSLGCSGSQPWISVSPCCWLRAILAQALRVQWGSCCTCEGHIVSWGTFCACCPSVLPSRQGCSCWGGLQRGAILVKWTKSVLCFAFSLLVLVLFEISVSGGSLWAPPPTLKEKG